MKLVFEDWDESFLDVEDYQVERALNNAAIDAIRRARRFGTNYVIWENDRVKQVPPDQTGPYEQTLLKNVERISQKIAELQAKQPNALELNEDPDEPK